MLVVWLQAEETKKLEAQPAPAVPSPSLKPLADISPGGSFLTARARRWVAMAENALSKSWSSGIATKEMVDFSKILDFLKFFRLQNVYVHDEKHTHFCVRYVGFHLTDPAANCMMTCSFR